jgi:polysaccharide transporter, PST family
VRRVLDNVAWLVADRAARLTIGFAVSVIVTRQLGPEAYGSFSYAQASVAVLSFLSVAAIEAIVVRMLVDEPDSHAEILGSALALRLLGGMATLVVAVAVNHFAGRGAGLALVIALIAAATMFQSADVVDYWLRRRLASRYAVIARTVALVAGAGFRIAALQTRDPLLALAGAIFLEAALAAALLIYALHAVEPSSLAFRPTLARMTRLLRESSPLLLATIAIGIYVRFGFIVVGDVAGHAQVGQLAVASIVVEALHALPVAISATYGPILLAKRTTSPVLFEHELTQMLRLFVAAAFVISGAVCLLAPTGMTLVFGDAYAESGAVLAILVWSIVFVYINVASELWFVGTARQLYLLPKTMIAAACYLVLINALAPDYGAKGAAVATIVTYSITDFWSNLLFKATRPLFYRQARALLLLGPSRANSKPSNTDG